MDFEQQDTLLKLGKIYCIYLTIRHSVLQWKSFLQFIYRSGNLLQLILINYSSDFSKIFRFYDCVMVIELNEHNLYHSWISHQL